MLECRLLRTKVGCGPLCRTVQCLLFQVLACLCEIAGLAFEARAFMCGRRQLRLDTRTGLRRLLGGGVGRGPFGCLIAHLARLARNRLGACARGVGQLARCVGRGPRLGSQCGFGRDLLLGACTCFVLGLRADRGGGLRQHVGVGARPCGRGFPLGGRRAGFAGDACFVQRRDPQPVLGDGRFGRACAFVRGGGGCAFRGAAVFSQIPGPGFGMGTVLRGAGGLGLCFNPGERLTDGAQFGLGVYRSRRGTAIVGNLGFVCAGVRLFIRKDGRCLVRMHVGLPSRR